MPNLLARLFGIGDKPSGSVAKERLQLVLVHDRSNLTPEQVRLMKDEILEVIARYVDFDSENVMINLKNEDRDSVLTAEIPITPNTTRRQPAPSDA
jgi:cell division topological specificity factor